MVEESTEPQAVDEPAESQPPAVTAASEAPAQTQAAAEVPRRKEVDDERPRRVEVSFEEKAERGEKICRQILTLLGATSDKIASRIEKEQVFVELGTVQCHNEKSLEPRVYESLQFILDKAINRHALKRSRLTLEAEGFRSRNKDGFASIAHAVGRKVKKLGKSIAIGPISGSDLRVFSSQLNRVSGVRVKTVGEADGRRLIVSPGNSRRRRRR